MKFYEIMRVMKITMVLLICMMLQVSASTFAQRVTLNKKNSSIHLVLEEISNQTNYNFFYKTSIFNGSKPVTIQVKNATLEQTLDECFADSPYSYQIDGTSVTITKNSGNPSGAINQQQIKISGRVISQIDNEPLSGVSIKIKGTNIATKTDANGNFSIQITSPGATLVFTFLGMRAQEVKVTERNSNITVRMLENISKLEEVAVTVQARRKADTEMAVLEERRKSSIVQDAISAQQIERTASITTTQALQRVSGVTISDDKYVAIRGLGDRSVIAQLNGVRLASSDPDRSVIPLDLVPAGLLDNVTVYKTVTPDKPADAAAGIIELKTKSIPSEQILSFSVQSGSNSQVAGNVNSFYNSELGIIGQHVKNNNLSEDFLQLGKQYPNGMLDIQRLISSGRNSPEQQAEINRVEGIMQSFDPVLTTRYKKASLNQIYNLNYGNSFNLKNDHQIGVIVGLNYYKRTNDINQGDLTQWSIYQGVLTGNDQVSSPRVIPNYVTPNTINLGKYLNYKENTGTEKLNYGFLTGLAYRFNPSNEISLQYVGSRGAETEASNLSGSYEYSGLSGTVDNHIYSLKQTYRTLNTFNLQGEHRLFGIEYGPRLSYNLASSSSIQKNPDYRFANLADYKPIDGGFYTRPNKQEGSLVDFVATDHLYSLVSGYVNGYGPYGIIQADPNGRRWRELHEENYNYKADLSIPFPLFGIKQEFKTGVNYLHRKRSFTENMMSIPGSNFSENKNLPLYQVYGNLDRLVSPENIGVRLPSEYNGEGQPLIGGFLYNPQKSPNNYRGFYETRAFYGMMDLRPTNSLRLTGGVRFEYTDIQSAVDTSGVFLDPSISSTDADGNKVRLVYIEPNTKYQTNYTPYYSLNLTYTLQDKMNFRLGYNNTLARPELRELTNVFDFNPFLFALVVGNRHLINQHNQNFDFRWEWFPNPGEVISASVFYKEIRNQLTRVYKLNSTGLNAKFPEFPAIEFQNDPNTGQVYGIELEFVKNLGSFWDPLSGFHIGSNLLLAESNIKKTAERLAASRAIDRRSPANSPLFEQAPYSINAFLNYTNEKWGFDLTSSFNMVGERLIQINLSGEPDLYTRPQPVLDFVLSQKLGKRIQAKCFIKNVLDRPVAEVYANPGTGGYFYDKQYFRRSYRTGSEIMVGLFYNLL